MIMKYNYIYILIDIEKDRYGSMIIGNWISINSLLTLFLTVKTIEYNTGRFCSKRRRRRRGRRRLKRRGKTKERRRRRKRRGTTIVPLCNSNIYHWAIRETCIIIIYYLVVSIIYLSSISANVHSIIYIYREENSIPVPVLVAVTPIVILFYGEKPKPKQTNKQQNIFI